MCRDPVCGEDVDPETTPWTARYLEQIFYFCCEKCLQAFNGNPKQFIRSDGIHSLVGSMLGLA